MESNRGHTEVDSMPTYQHYPVMAVVRAAAGLLKREGEKVIYRDAFRWKDDADDSVLSNHYEQYPLSYLADTFGYEIVHDFNHVAVIRNRTDETVVQS